MIESPLYKNLGLANGMGLPVDSPVDPGPGPGPDPATSRIPLPNYADPNSRLAYATAFRNKYGKEALSGYGDIPLRINERPGWGSNTSKNLAMAEGKRLGLDPALLYASSMIEGQSGLYPGADKSLPAGLVKTTGDKDYPISGLWNFGLDSFQDYLPMLKKKGYLPQDFEKNYKVWDKPGAPSGAGNRPESVMFKNADVGIQAKGAMMKSFYDELDDYAKKGNVKLTPEQRDYFALAHFNSGAHGYEMMDAYNKAGLLKDDKFIDKMPGIDVPFKVNGKLMSKEKAAALHKQIYNNVLPRILAAKGLKAEGYFDEPAVAKPAQQQIMKLTK